MRNKPAYAIGSVDSALLLATLLQQEGAMRVTDVAARLGVSVSTAHRLLGMLVYRDFAEQLPDRRYAPGPVLRPGAVPQASVTTLREVAVPHLRRLVDAVGETANVVLLAGAVVRFVATVESRQVLRVGDRTGRTLPAHLASGGKALLAAMDDAGRAAVLAALDEADGARLERELRTVRRRGFALNDQATEAGLTAVGVAVPAAGGVEGAALSLAAPSVRYSRDRLPEWVAHLTEAAEAVARELGAA
ncbi:DNA-binding transcriptional regulator, IclR family [Blastococcus sp. DSM 46786]|uniref:IclR family transcriptional regulator n=1 Tax=Blastococcus sp. DSM 46786 TaxID=1798227 RepID=UPI0008AE734B|nr:IclR family transcriptional regulator [Blastococcus sp. DSM 46786]SEL07738.1 DNA-binding transcriptional regulator, IclR family [Blastococcus sp. DSM 46786]